MSDPEFSWQQSQEVVAQQLTQEAQGLIDVEGNPIMRGYMIAAAVEEGLPIGVDEILDSLAGIPEEYDAESEHTQPYEHKNEIIRRTIKALAQLRRFTDADVLISLAQTQEPYTYLDGIVDVIKQGYGGPDSAYLHLSKEHLCEVAIAPSPYDDDAELTEEWLLETQSTYLDYYLGGMAEAGINFFEFGSEHNFIYNAMLAMQEALVDISSDMSPRDVQRSLLVFAQDYTRGGHTELAGMTKDMIQDHIYKATACLEMLGYTEDPATQDALLLEIFDLQQQTATCNGACGFEDCSPSAFDKNLQLQLVEARLKMHAIDLAEVQALAQTYEEQYAFTLASIHLEMYKQTGDEAARSKCLSYFNNLSTRPVETISSRLLEVAAADVQSGRTMPYEGEDTPQVCWEVESIFWSATRYIEAALDANASEETEHTVDVDDEAEESGISLHAINRWSSAYERIWASWEAEVSLRQRDHAFGTFAAMLAEQGSLNAARQLLQQIGSGEEKVRGMLAIANALRHD